VLSGLLDVDVPVGGFISARDCFTYITRSSFKDISFPGGNGGVVGAWSSVSCSSLLCDALLSHVTVTSSNFTQCSTQGATGTM
jgi:hypothetical protein